MVPKLDRNNVLAVALFNAAEHDRKVQLCEEYARRKPERRAAIFEAFFGKQPKVKRGRGSRR